jgi:hypothetical protein
MLDELLKHNSLGTKEEIQFILFNALTVNEQKTDDLKSYCISNKYSISRSLSGIIALFKYVGLIKLYDDSIIVEPATFNKNKYFGREANYFNEPHFYECLFSSLRTEKQTHQIFTQKNVLFDAKENSYFIKSNLIPFRSFPLRNLLLSLEFFKIAENNSNHLIIGQQFYELFERLVVNNLNVKKKTKRPITIKKLKEGLKEQERVGKETELFALEYEKNRLKEHPFRSKIKRIAEEFTNAGYDIESFTGLNTIVPNRFIEVKSYTDQVSFYWSRNEVDTAKELGEEYFLYLVDRSKYLLKDYKPMILKDPYDRIFESELWKTETENWKITLD